MTNERALRSMAAFADREDLVAYLQRMIAAYMTQAEKMSEEFVEDWLREEADHGGMD